MYIQQTLSTAIEMFLSSVTKVATYPNQLGFNLKTTVTVLNINTIFYTLVNPDNQEVKISARLNNNKQKLELGKSYVVYGYLYFNISKNSSDLKISNVYVNLAIDAFEELPDSTPPKTEIVNIINQLSLPQASFPYPKYNNKLKVALVCPKGSMTNGAHATSDFMSPICSLWIEDYLEITEFPCRIENVEEVTNSIKSISQQKFDIFVLIRGGGDYDNIKVLDHPDIALAINQLDKKCYKILGAGHEKDRLLLEMAFDHVTQTPTQASEYIIKQIRSLKQKSNTHVQTKTIDNSSDNIKSSDSKIFEKLDNFDSKISSINAINTEVKQQLISLVNKIPSNDISNKEINQKLIEITNKLSANNTSNNINQNLNDLYNKISSINTLLYNKTYSINTLSNKINQNFTKARLIFMGSGWLLAIILFLFK